LWAFRADTVTVLDALGIPFDAQIAASFSATEGEFRRSAGWPCRPCRQRRANVDQRQALARQSQRWREVIAHHVAAELMPMTSAGALKINIGVHGCVVASAIEG
jgi:hypothetical protein